VSTELSSSTKRVSDELFLAHAKIRSAALQIGDVAESSPELQKLASEVMTMASVTEIVAYAAKDGNLCAVK
jgi:hypothetical protein